MSRYKVVVAGALGVVGRGFLEEISQQEDWEIIGLSRRQPDFETRARFISVDLTDRDACQAQLGRLTGVTHIVYAAVNEQENLVAGWRELDHVQTNLKMLKNLLEVIEPNSPELQHVTLLQGAKAYGTHLGRYPIPARETAPRHFPPNFYYHQEDYLKERQAGKNWTWTIIRPPLVVGFATRSSMNILTSIAAYAAICKEMGLPFRFPGTNLTHIAQAVDNRLLGRAIYWAATNPSCANQIFNITNGDCYTWEPLWLRFAEFFGVEYAPPQPISLAAAMVDKEPLWQLIVDKYNLRPYKLADIASWAYADYQFNKTADSYLSTIKARQFGFHDCMDTEQMFIDWFQRLQRERVIPG